MIRRGVVKLLIFFGRAVWGVIGSDTGKGPITETFDEGFAVCFASQRRVHFIEGIVVLQASVGKLDMVGACLSADRDASRNRPAEDIDRGGGADVLHVDMGTGEFGKDDVAGYDDILGGFRPTAETKFEGPFNLIHNRAFGKAGFLAMIHNRQIKHVGVLHGAAHDFIALHALSVVSDRHDSRFLELAGGGEMFANHSNGKATGRVNPDDRVLPDGVVDALDGSGIIANGVGVRHTDHGGVSSGGGGL